MIRPAIVVPLMHGTFRISRADEQGRVRLLFGTLSAGRPGSATAAVALFVSADELGAIVDAIGEVADDAVERFRSKPEAVDL